MAQKFGTAVGLGCFMPSSAFVQISLSTSRLVSAACLVSCNDASRSIFARFARRGTLRISQFHGPLPLHPQDSLLCDGDAARSAGRTNRELPVVVCIICDRERVLRQSPLAARSGSVSCANAADLSSLRRAGSAQSRAAPCSFAFPSPR